MSSQQHVDCIFCINTGRSGSHYLSELFHLDERCVSLHEPSPIGNGEAMRDYMFGKTDKMEAVAKERASQIRECIAQGKVYVETNHCFIKGFGWLLPKYIEDLKVGVIVLSRDREKIAQSLYRIGCSTLSYDGRHWLFTPEKDQPLVTPPGKSSAKLAYNTFHIAWKKINGKREPAEYQSPDWLEAYELEALRWYVDETNALGKHYQTSFPQFSYYDTTIDELNQKDTVKALFEFFGLHLEANSHVIGKATNLKQANATI